MARLKSFEQFVTEMDRAEEIEKDIVDQGSPEAHSEEEAEEVQQQTNEAEAGIDAEDLKGKTKDTTPDVVDIEGEKYPKAEDAADDSIEKDLDNSLEEQPDGDDEIAKEVTESEEADEPKEEIKEEEVKSVAERLKECFAEMKNEAKVWEEDEYDEHTVETYMSETASLVGGLAANSLKEMKEEYAIEAFEAACNSMKEAFCKKVDEVKEEVGAPEAEEVE